MRAAKTRTQLTIPILPELARVMDATKTGDLTFIATATGAPMRKKSFGNWFREACVSAGVPGSAHGLRKAGAARAASNGATVAQLEAIFGWRGGTMASLYTKSADQDPPRQERRSANSREERNPEISIPNLFSGAGTNGKGLTISMVKVEGGAVKRTRTSTPVKELAPQASASTSSAMTARFRFNPAGAKRRRSSNKSLPRRQASTRRSKLQAPPRDGSRAC